MSTKSIIEDIQKIQTAAGFDANRTYPMLFQHLGYRKHVAEQLLRESDENKIKELTELFEYLNSDIKSIMGL